MLYPSQVSRPDVFKNPASNWRVFYDWLSAVVWKDIDIFITRWKFQLNFQPL